MFFLIKPEFYDSVVKIIDKHDLTKEEGISEAIEEMKWLCKLTDGVPFHSLLSLKEFLTKYPSFQHYKKITLHR